MKPKLLPQFDRTAPYKGPISLDHMLVKWKFQLLSGELPKSGSFTADLARLSPEDRAKFDRAHIGLQAVREGFHEPFKKPVGFKEWADHFEVANTEENRVLANRAAENLHNESITLGLLDRMGSDAQLPPEPVTLRDQVEAAMDAVKE